MTTSKKHWPRFLKFFRILPQLGMSVDVSRMNFGDDIFQRMRQKIDQAFTAMKELEDGAIANPDEKRMVGHYWLRAPSHAPTKEITDAITASIDKIKKFAADIHSGAIKTERGASFKHVLVVGIGGSALGPQLLADALTDEKSPMKLHFLDNTDSDGFNRVKATLKPVLDETLVIVTSKSGGTPETRNGAMEMAHFYDECGLKFAKHAVAVTQVGSKLDQQTKAEGWLDRFEMWDWVGGRVSITSAVGLLPAALAGIAIDELLLGARTMDELTRINDIDQNPSMLLALMWFHAGGGLGKKDMVVLPYKDRLVLFSKYLQQLVMESLGKERDLSGKVVNQGIAVYGNKGSTDQHAYVQQLRDGINNFFATFIEVLSDQAPEPKRTGFLAVDPDVSAGDYLEGFLLGTRRALHENGRESITITLDELSPYSLGALIALYERTVGFYASLVNINAYHQPGVEAGKKAAAAVLEIQTKVIAELRKNKGKDFSVEQISAAIGAPDDLETIYKVLEHLASNPGRGVHRKGAYCAPDEARYNFK